MTKAVAASELDDERLARREREVVVEGYAAACDDIGCCGMVADDFGIAFDGHCGLLACAVENGKHGASLMLTGDDVDSVVGDELRHGAPDDDVVPLPPMEQSRQP